MKQDRKTKPRAGARSEGFAKPMRTGARPAPRSRSEARGAPPSRAGARPAPRSRSDAGPSPRFRGEERAAPRFRSDERPPPRFRSDERAAPRADYRDPYRSAQRPPRAGKDEFAPREERGTRGFTVTLDPDVARVFRGDASVNKALRLVLQMMQVVQGPRPLAARSEGAARSPRGPGYQGSAEARGFTRKPRFTDDDDKEHEIEE